MKQTDLIVSKDNEAKRLQDQILTLTERIANLNIALGAKEEALKSKDNEIKRITEESKKSDKVIIKTVKHGPYGVKEDTTYSNLKDVESEIRKEVETKTKKSISELENLQLDLEIKIESLEKELQRKDKVVRAETEEWEDKTRKRYNKLIEAHREEIDELKEQIQKVKKNKTEEELEKARKAELDNLNITVDILTQKLALLKGKSWFARMIDKFTGVEARMELELEELRLKANVLSSQANAAAYSHQRYSRPARPTDSYYAYGVNGVGASFYCG